MSPGCRPLTPLGVGCGHRGRQAASDSSGPCPRSPEQAPGSTHACTQPTASPAEQGADGRRDRRLRRASPWAPGDHDLCPPHSAPHKCSAAPRYRGQWQAAKLRSAADWQAPPPHAQSAAIPPAEPSAALATAHGHCQHRPWLPVIHPQTPKPLAHRGGLRPSGAPVLLPLPHWLSEARASTLAPPAPKPPPGPSSSPASTCLESHKQAAESTWGRGPGESSLPLSATVLGAICEQLSELQTTGSPERPECAEGNRAGDQPPQDQSGPTCVPSGRAMLRSPGDRTPALGGWSSVWSSPSRQG